MSTDTLLSDARALAGKLQSSELYRSYCLSKNDLLKDPLLLERVKAYKSIQWELEIKRLKEGGVGFEEEKRVSREYIELSLNPVAKTYLDCEHELLALYRETMDIICEACDLDLPPQGL